MKVHEAPLARKFGNNLEPILCGLYRLSYQADNDIEHAWVSVFSNAHHLPCPKLDKLPFDILQLFFEILDIKDIENLSLATPTLHRVIRDTNIVKTASLVLEEDQKLSLFVSKFKTLESVSLELKAYPLLSKTIPPVGIWQSARTMTSLVIDSRNLEIALFGSAPRPNRPNYRIADAFPSLKTLSIEYVPVLSSSALENLPQSLTCLSIKCKIGSSILGKLPDITHLSNLESLHLSPFVGMNDSESYDFSRFPRLRSLQVPNFTQKIIISSKSEINCLHIQKTDTVQFLENLNPPGQVLDSHLFELRRLTSLQIELAIDWQSLWPHIPRSLTSLKICYLAKPEDGDEDVLLQLPPNLIYISLQFQYQSFAVNNQHWDLTDRLKALKAQKLANGENFWFFSAQKLDLSGGPSAGAVEWLEVLPPTLRVHTRPFALTLKPNSGIEVIDFKKKLPFVSSLVLTPEFPYPEQQVKLLKSEDYANICSIHPLHICRRFTLPSFLKDLTIYATNYGPLSPFICEPSCPHSKLAHESILELICDSLPETLERFLLLDNVRPARVGRLPRGLLRLHLSFRIKGGLQPTSYDGGRVTSMARASEEFEKSLQELPEALQSLALKSDRLIGDTKAFLTSLPRSILSLEIPIVEKFENEDIPLLPPRLTKLDVRRSENVSDEGFVKLPKTLRILWFGLNRKLTPKFLQSLPSFPSLNLIMLPRNMNFPNSLLSEVAEAFSSRPKTADLIRRVHFLTKKLKYYYN